MQNDDLKEIGHEIQTAYAGLGTLGLIAALSDECENEPEVQFGSACRAVIAALEPALERLSKEFADARQRT